MGTRCSQRPRQMRAPAPLHQNHQDHDQDQDDEGKAPQQIPTGHAHNGDLANDPANRTMPNLKGGFAG